MDCLTASTSRTETAEDGGDAAVLSEDLLDRYAEDARATGLTEKTVTEYLCCVRVFARMYPGEPVADLGHDHLRGLLRDLRGRDLADASIGRYFSALNSFFDFLTYVDMVEANPVPGFRKRYLRNLRSTYRSQGPGEVRQLIDVETMGKLINLALKPRDKAIMAVLAKTGIRRSEIVALDVSDIDWSNLTIHLKDTPKRKGNRTVFIDDEGARILRDWIDARAHHEKKDHEPALFLNQMGTRLARTGVANVVRKYATKLGIHDPDSDDPTERFTPHCFRHWFTTWMRRAGLDREHLAELRGDVRTQTVDYYIHIDKEDLRREYLRCVPRLYLV